MLQSFTFISASDLYDLVEFQTNSPYNLPPPKPRIALLIGCVLSGIGFGLWIRRVQSIYRHVGKERLVGGSTRLRCWLTAYIDNDSALFTCIRMAAQSFLFLGALQLNYHLAFLGMLAVFALESSCDSIRVLLCYRDVVDIRDLVVTSKFLRADLRHHPVTTTLEPSNVYEDLTRDSFIVGMVFVTQVILIAFVVMDVFASETHTCMDGSTGCPVTGTLGSYVVYLLGIFMACVFQLGPKTSFGKSEQNPAFWLQLLLSTKQSPTYTWYDPVDAETKTLRLRPSDCQPWIRFLMSFLINGIGWHVLVHALPIQVAGQSSLTGVVLRAVGMMYLVDLDDTTGYIMTMVPEGDGYNLKDGVSTEMDDSSVGSAATSYRFFSGIHGFEDERDVPVAAQKIVAKAQAQLNALKSKMKRKQRKQTATQLGEF